MRFSPSLPPSLSAFSKLAFVQIMLLPDGEYTIFIPEVPMENKTEKGWQVGILLCFLSEQEEIAIVL